MKKFGKIFGVATLAFASITAGIIGLSGCANKWKNPDRIPDPEEPPAIVTPPEEKPLVGVASLEEIKAYMAKESVDTTFTTFRVVSNVPNTGLEDEIIGLEFLGNANGEDGKADMILVHKFAGGMVVTNYAPVSSEAMFVKVEKGEEELLKNKITDETEITDAKTTMTNIYTQMSDAKIQFAGLEEIKKQTDNFKSVTVRTSFKDTTTFEITYTCSMTENDEETATSYQMKYNGRFVLNFVNSKIDSLETETVGKRVDNGMEYKTSAKIEAIETLDMPADLDEYPESVTVESLTQYLADANVNSTFEGFEINAINGNAVINFSALKSEDALKMINLESDVTYYYSHNSDDQSVYTFDGDKYTRIEDEQQTTLLSEKFTGFYNEFSSAKFAFESLLTCVNADTGSEIIVSKYTNGDTIKYVINYSYTAADEEDENITYKNTGIFSMTFANGVIQSLTTENAQTEVGTENVTNSNLIINRLSTLAWPEIPGTSVEPEPEVVA